MRIVQSVQICQKETHVHENGHDERYKYVGMQCQNNGNLGEMRYTWKPHMKRNKNLIYDYDMGAETENRDIQKYIKNDNPETVETDNQKEIFFARTRVVMRLIR